MKMTILTVEDAKASGNAMRVLYDDLVAELGGCSKEELEKVPDETLALMQVFGDAMVALMSLKEDIVIDVPDETKSE